MVASINTPKQYAQALANELSARSSRRWHAEIDALSDTAYRVLRRRIEAFLALPATLLRKDPARLEAQLARIGTLQA